ncbi:hypothetical protein TrVGV298_003838 [Trichoderma virens]|nr:hypothetical protein TrVGV298_003838 [Trichoderma virens]
MEDAPILASVVDRRRSPAPDQTRVETANAAKGPQADVGQRCHAQEVYGLANLRKVHRRLGEMRSLVVGRVDDSSRPEALSRSKDGVNGGKFQRNRGTTALTGPENIN